MHVYLRERPTNLTNIFSNMCYACSVRRAPWSGVELTQTFNSFLRDSKNIRTVKHLALYSVYVLFHHTYDAYQMIFSFNFAFLFWDNLRTSNRPVPFSYSFLLQPCSCNVCSRWFCIVLYLNVSGNDGILSVSKITILLFSCITEMYITEIISKDTDTI